MTQQFTSPTDPGTMTFEDLPHHIEYELARMEIGMLSKDRDAIDRIHRVMKVMQMKKLVGKNYNVEIERKEDGKFVYLIWEDPRPDHPIREARFDTSSLTFEGAEMMRVVYGVMAK